MIKVMIVDDHNIVREGLKKILSLCDEIKVVSEASSGKEALNLLSASTQLIDIVLIDVRIPEMDGIETTKYIRDQYPKTKVIILTTFNEDEYIFRGLKNGASGYILKDIKPNVLIECIISVYDGNVFLQPEVATKVVGKLKSEKETINVKTDPIMNKNRLTSREEMIARMISNGKSNKEISKLLYITDGTVRNHISKILSKLYLRDRTQIALYMQNRYARNDPGWS